MCERNPDGTYKKGHQGLRGYTNGHWKGDSVGYFGKHFWIYNHYGKADHCEFCDNTAKRYEWSNISGEYKRDISDYRQLCPSYHRKFDKGNFCKNGHEFTKENTWIRKNGWRVCRTCNRKRTESYKKMEVCHL